MPLYTYQVFTNDYETEQPWSIQNYSKRIEMYLIRSILEKDTCTQKSLNYNFSPHPLIHSIRLHMLE